MANYNVCNKGTTKINRKIKRFIHEYYNEFSNVAY